VIGLCPGTMERVCIIIGHPDNVEQAHELIWEKINRRVDSSAGGAKIGNEDIKVVNDVHFLVV
jgi:hypothetical protein